MTDMTNGSQMVFSFRTFLLVKKADSRGIESGNIGGKPNGTSQIRRTALRHIQVISTAPDIGE